MKFFLKMEHAIFLLSVCLMNWRQEGMASLAYDGSYMETKVHLVIFCEAAEERALLHIRNNRDKYWLSKDLKNSGVCTSSFFWIILDECHLALKILPNDK